MAAFERIKCGIEGLDQAFDNIRLGDNVVWQLSKLEDFHYVVDPFVQQAIADKRDLVYIRFASHDELVPECPEVSRYTLDPRVGFEPFTVEVRSIITKHGFDAFYVFDCLSELQVAWNADLMMGNFFRVTCPYLFVLDTVAYFPVLRGSHSFAAIAKIRDTTQLLIDVYSQGDELFIHPLKVWNRYGSTMFMAHSFEPQTGEVKPLTDGMEANRFYGVMNAEDASAPDRNTDSWDRFFGAMQAFDQQGMLPADACEKMCNMMMTKDVRMREMLFEYYTPADYFAVRNRMVGTGHIGGKACGMLLARKILETDLPEMRPYFEPHDSYFVGSDVFYTYLVYNDLWKLRIDQRTPEGFVDAAEPLREGLMSGSFPEDLRESFRRLLDYYGQSPIIVRSSSFLEDGFGNAFAGKYESVFCSNAGTPEERLEEFEQAIRIVYGSTMDPSALEYRLRNGLDRSEEQMALLVQRVSGSHLEGGLFAPTAAGVGYSHSAYCWLPDMDPTAGMLRLVMGLGTKAVDRTSTDYARVISLDRPKATTFKSDAERHRFSQRKVDMLDLAERAQVEKPFDVMAELIPQAARNMVLQHDREAESLFRERGQSRQVLFANCEGLACNGEFTGLMRSVLHALHEAYGSAVDIEYTINVGADGRFQVCLLQCRPLRVMGAEMQVSLPELERNDTFFHIREAAMGDSREVRLDAVVMVDPERYYNCAYAKKPTVVRLVGAANKWLKDGGRRAVLMTPGRIGTSSPELGVPVAFADMCNFEGVCEIAYSKAGYSPELSFGSHMFQDLVEAEIYYGAVFEDEKTVHYEPAFIDGMVEVTGEVMSGEDIMQLLEDEELQDIVRIYVPSDDRQLTMWHDMIANETVCGYSGDCSE